MNVFLIGGTGFIGRHVTARLVRADHDVTLFHRGHMTADLPDSVTTVHGNRNDPAALRDALDSSAPDVVLDIIPYTEEQAQALAQLCSQQTDRLVVVSSGDVYRQYNGLLGASEAPPDPVPLSEKAPLRTARYPYRDAETDFPYAHDYEKILVEERVRAADVPATILRLPKVYGPADNEHHLREDLDRLRETGETLVLTESQARWRWSRGYVDNVAAAIVAAVTDSVATGRTYNVGEPDALPEATWLRRLAEVAGLSTSIRTVPDDQRGDPPPLQWDYSMALDTRRIRTELGFAEPISHEQALVRTIVWENAEGNGGTRGD